ncbi:MAG: CPBP family intramembrane glutamic endopeptidase [Schlesneria sp.]
MTELNSRENDPLPTDLSRSENESVPIFSSGTDTDVIALENRDFVQDLSAEQSRPDTCPPSVVAVDSPPSMSRGIGEAMGWLFGAWLVHVIAAVCIGILLIIRLIVNNVASGKVQPMNLDDSNSTMIITTGEMVLFVLAAILAVALRYRGRMFNELNFTRPDSRHIWIVVAATLPLTFCIAIWSVPTQLAWDSIVEMFPALKMIDGMNVNEEIKRMADSTPLLLMIFSIAVLPAIGEELIFRGAIGRTLIANLGLWSGILLTSFLFGWFHVHPVHAISVMPLGLVMHVVYLWTRSFWLPMLLHFVNNCWAIIVAHFSKTEHVIDGGSLNLLEGLQMITAIIAVIALGFGLWQSRVRLVREDGSVLDPGRFPLRVPTGPGVHRQSNPMNPWCWKLALVSSALCHALVVFELVNPR